MAFLLFSVEMKQVFVFDREKKKAQMPDGQGEERNLQKKQIRKKSLQTIS